MKLPKSPNLLPDTSSAKVRPPQSTSQLPKPRPDFSLIKDLYSLGYKNIVGLDEVGRGALAGPIVVVAVELPLEIAGINDSKLLSRQARENFATKIELSATQKQFGIVSNIEIDQLGVSAALKLAYARALENIEADLYLTDFIQLVGKTNLRAIRGDSLFYPVAAASIMAKVYRDNLMRELHPSFEDYCWDQNVGYGTRKHLDAINKCGPSPHHRQTFLR